MKATWCDSLASGNETIDSQHKELFEHMNAFFDNITHTHNHETTVRTLNFLVKYVRYHFGTEEELMRESEYPHFKEHLNAHRIIVDKLMECYKDLIRSGNTEVITEELGVLLQKWFVEHIMDNDIKLAEHLKNNA
ncbi:MAG: hypothetical protein C0603_12975 [Denitrovibrio sp.]|nr:MAG: hypothetical protein C0603_12975 [Denitrovibrio sp.]